MPKRLTALYPLSGSGKNHSGDVLKSCCGYGLPLA